MRVPHLPVKQLLKRLGLRGALAALEAFGSMRRPRAEDVVEATELRPMQSINGLLRYVGSMII